MKGNLLKYPGRKWSKHESLWNEEGLRPHLPVTELFTPQSFKKMIEQHPVVFLKPDLGMRGQGIVKVSRVKEGECTIQTASKTYKRRGASSAARRLKKLIGGKRYIVQQGIDLIRIKGRPVDFRILLHKTNGKWKFFGIMGKVAAKNRFVTNYARGGKAIRLQEALSKAFGNEKLGDVNWDERLKSLSLQLAEALQKYYPNVTELGLDVAIDADQRIWLLEANTRPQYQLFRHHANRGLYARIASSVRSVRAAKQQR
ncbi:YheC/YheD family protein [Paenibacillus sp. H1-7]|uniref:YheC/YheD family protein n=1 Tax=Paenibacillus sp. H1-7 TaxID=2282849 RepID=UPI001EF88775|nr:YheC/YheD family protein [Paenibacillus sp. H1-7]